MEVNTAQLALVARDIDAAVGSEDYLRLRDQGAARIVYTTRGQDVALTSNSTFLGSESFLQKYPQIATRVLKVFIKNAKWLAETPATQVYQLWTKSGKTFASFREDFTNEDVKYKFSPLLDPYLAARYKFQLEQARRLGLVRNGFVYEQWLEPKFLDRALKELNLTGYWQPRGLDGKPAQPDNKSADARTTQAAPAPAGG
jgi:sulfonate transport system substrate-binding protein